MEGEIKPTPVEATRNAIADAIGGDTPAEQTAPSTAPVTEDQVTPAPAQAEAPAENTVTEEDAIQAAKTEAEPEAKVETKPEEPEEDEDIDSILDKREPKIPAYRLKKKAEQAKQAKSEAEKLKEELAARDARIAALEAKRQSPDDQELEEEVEELTPAALKAIQKLGYVKKDDILAEVDSRFEEQAERTTYRQQIRQDFASLGQWAEKNGYPKFKASEVVAFAEKNYGEDVVLTGPVLKTAYTALHNDAIVDAQVKARLAQAGKTATAEKPRGSAAPATPAAASAAEGKGWRDQVAAVVGGSE